MKTETLKSSFVDFRPLYISQALFNGCFYGAKAIFVLYVMKQFSLSESEAIAFFATFMTLCYGTSLIGGHMADKGLGVKNTILLGGISSALGFLCILSPVEDVSFLGLALASLGSGYFKPNLLTAAGLVFENPKDPRKERVCSLVYVAMNLGGLVAPVLCGLIGKTWGWNYGILFVAAVFAGTTWVVHKTLWFHPANNKPGDLSLSKGKLLLVNILLLLLLYLLFKYKGYFHSLMGMITCASLLYMGNIYYQCSARERKAVLTIIGYIFVFSLFCALFEQAGTSVLLFYEKALDREILGFTIPASAFLSLDPLFVLLFGSPLLALSAKYAGKTRFINGVVKVGFGFSCAALTFGILAFSAYWHKTSLISPFWIVAAMLAQVMGEMWVAPLSFAKISEHAPPRFQSILMGFWPMAIAYGHYFAGLIAAFSLHGDKAVPDHPFSAYQTFFMHIALVALCASLSLILYQWIRYGIKKRKDGGLEVNVPGVDL